MTIDFLGDICLTYYNRTATDLVNLADRMNIILGDSDFRIGNLENSILTEGMFSKADKRGPCLNMSHTSTGFLKRLNVDCYSLANNHIGDYGIDGIKSTVDELIKIEKIIIGLGERNKKRLKPFRIEKDNAKVSIFSVCENEFGTAESLGYGAEGFEVGAIKEALKREKKDKRIVFVFFHGGLENYPFPTPEQRERYRTLVELGADAIVNSHQHCCLGFEKYKGKYIFYGIGNFFFPRRTYSIFDAGWNYGYTLRLVIKEDNNIDYDLIPHGFDNSGNFELLDKDIFENYIKNLSTPITEDRELFLFYGAWAEIMGSMRYEQLLYEVAAKTQEKDLLIKSLFCCESHNELMKTYMKIKIFGRHSSSNLRKRITEAVNCDFLNNYPKLNVKKVIWGVTKNGVEQLNILKDDVDNYRAEIIFVDRDPKKQNFRIGGCIICSPEYVLKRFKKADYHICLPDKYVEDVKQMILSYGIKESHIYED